MTEAGVDDTEELIANTPAYLHHAIWENEIIPLRRIAWTGLQDQVAELRHDVRTAEVIAVAAMVVSLLACGTSIVAAVTATVR